MEEPSYTVPVYQFEMVATRPIQIIIIHNLFQSYIILPNIPPIIGQRSKDPTIHSSDVPILFLKIFDNKLFLK